MTWRSTTTVWSLFVVLVYLTDWRFDPILVPLHLVFLLALPWLSLSLYPEQAEPLRRNKALLGRLLVFLMTLVAGLIAYSVAASLARGMHPLPTFDEDPFEVPETLPPMTGFVVAKTSLIIATNGLAIGLLAATVWSVVRSPKKGTRLATWIIFALFILTVGLAFFAWLYWTVAFGTVIHAQPFLWKGSPRFSQIEQLNQFLDFAFGGVAPVFLILSAKRLANRLE